MPDYRLGVVVTVHGRVQGVRYRSWTVETATAFGLSGWVRNKADGTVEALFVGTPDAVEAMVTASWEGPRLRRWNGSRGGRLIPPRTNMAFGSWKANDECDF